MSDSRPISDTYDLREMNLLLKRILVDDIDASDLSRDQISDRLSVAMGRRITKHMVDAWCAETNDNKIPGDVLPAWDAITKSDRVLSTLAEARGRRLSGRKEQLLIEFAQKTFAMEEIAARLAEIRKELGK